MILVSSTRNKSSNSSADVCACMILCCFITLTWFSTAQAGTCSLHSLCLSSSLSQCCCIFRAWDTEVYLPVVYSRSTVYVCMFVFTITFERHDLAWLLTLTLLCQRSKFAVMGGKHSQEEKKFFLCMHVTRLNKSGPEFETVKKLQPHVFSVFVEFFALKSSVGATSSEF